MPSTQSAVIRHVATLRSGFLAWSKRRRTVFVFVFVSVSLACVILSSGCAFSRGEIGDDFDREKIAGIKKGVTTRAEVIEALGAPDRILQVNGHDVMQYYHYDAKTGSLLLLLVNFSRFNIKSDDLYVFLNRDAIVTEVLFGKRTDQLEFQFWPFGD